MNPATWDFEIFTLSHPILKMWENSMVLIKIKVGVSSWKLIIWISGLTVLRNWIIIKTKTRLGSVFFSDYSFNNLNKILEMIVGAYLLRSHFQDVIQVGQYVFKVLFVLIHDFLHHLLSLPLKIFLPYGSLKWLNELSSKGSTKNVALFL